MMAIESTAVGHGMSWFVLWTLLWAVRLGVCTVLKVINLGQLHVYRKNHYDIQPWAWAAYPYCSA